MANPKDISKETEILPGEVIRHIPLTDIFIDYDYNVRSKSDVLSNTSDAVQDTTIKSEHQGEGTGLKGLALGLHKDGQDTPVVLRRVDGGKSLGGKKTDKPYELVCGFRRTTAAQMVSENVFAGMGDKDKDVVALAKSIEDAKKAKRPAIPNTADGTVLAVVRELTPKAARLLNGRENTQRQNLSTPDMVRYAYTLSTEEKMKQVEIGEALGVDQSYVARLLKIASLPKPVFLHWRGDTKLPGLPEAVTRRLTSREMSELAKDTEGQTEGEIQARYVEMLNPPPPVEGAEGAGTDSAMKRITELGTLLGVLVRAGVIESGSLAWSKVIGPKKEGYPVDTGKADATKRGVYWDAMEDAFEAALAPEDQKKGKAPKTPKEAKPEGETNAN